MNRLIVISDVGTIEGANHHFTYLMFGYPQSELLGQKITIIIPNFCDDLEYLGDTPVALPPFDFNKTDDDNSNHDSALENTDQDKSRHSKKDSFESERPSLTVENLGVELLKEEENYVTDVNANSAPAPVGEIVDSLNRLNHGYDKELSEGIPCESKPSSLSNNWSSTASAYESIPSTLEGAVNFRSVPPTTLNIVPSTIYFDTENGSDNGELTPIVTPRNDFVEHDDHFETTSDGEDDDTIEVIQDDEMPQTNNSNVSDMILGPFSPGNAPGNGKEMNVMVKVINTSSDSCGGCEESSIKLEKSFEGIEAVNKGGGDEMGKLVKSLRNIDNSEDLNVLAEAVDLIDEDLGKQSLDDAPMTSKPAIGKRPARKRMSKDLEDKQDLGVEKKIVDGSYVGYGRHKDGSNLDILYRVRGVVLMSGKKVFCVWTSRDPGEMGEGGRIGLGSLTLTSSFNSTVDNSLGQGQKPVGEQTNHMDQRVTTWKRWSTKHQGGE